MFYSELVDLLLATEALEVDFDRFCFTAFFIGLSFFRFRRFVFVVQDELPEN